MSEDVVPCDELREPFYCRGRCICGVLSELHTPEGWASFYERQADACDQSAADLAAESGRLAHAATDLRSRAASFPTPRKFDRPTTAGRPQEGDDHVA